MIARPLRRRSNVAAMLVPVFWTLVQPIALAALDLGAAGGIIENRGQLPEGVRYYASCREATIYFTDTAVVVDLVPQRYALWMRFAGARAPLRLAGGGVSPTRLHFFTGGGPGSLAARAYSEVVYRAAWPGLDVCFRVEHEQLFYCIRPAPGADLRQARFEFEGATQIMTELDGTRELRIPGRSLHDSAVSPTGLDRVVRWGCRLSTDAGSDPAVDNASSLTWSTLLGGADNDYSHGVALDAANCPIVTGYTHSLDFPVTPGAHDSIQSGSYDVFVARFAADASSLLWATFLGGSLEDRPFALALDRAGNIVVTGQTFSPDFPTTQDAHDRVLDGSRDVFASKLDPSGSVLLWSTYLGGSAWERAWGLALDADDRPVLAGDTGSIDFPTTSKAYDQVWSGGAEAFVTKLEADGETLTWSTFLGGSSNDVINALAIGATGRPIVTGTTLSNDFPVTVGAYDGTPNGGADAFIATLAAPGDSLVWSTYVGGSGPDVAYGLRLNRRGQAVIAGSTASVDFPVTIGALDGSANGNGDVFVAALDASGLAWSTYLGGSDADEAYALVLDPDDRPIVSGETASVDFPTTLNGFDRSYGGNRDAFVTQLDATGATLRWSTFLGGGEWESGWDFAVDSGGDPLLTGPTRSSDFPTTEGAFDRSYNGGGEDAFVLRLSLPPFETSVFIPPMTLPLRAWPNPFRESVELRFQLLRPSVMRLLVHDAAGRRVIAITPGFGASGPYSLAWSGLDARGRPVAPGVYWVRLETGGSVQQTKVVRTR
jgi:hypothetical protein